jgi:hypothetical protein
MTETVHTLNFIAENLRWLTTPLGNLFVIVFGFAWLALILFYGAQSHPDESRNGRPGDPKFAEASAGGPHVFIAAQSTPVTVRFSEATVSFSIFSCSPLTLTFVELRLGTAIFKEVFQERIDAFNPRFVGLSKTLNTSEMQQLKQQLKTSQTVSLFGTVKFGEMQQNFEFTVVPYFPAGTVI